MVQIMERLLRRDFRLLKVTELASFEDRRRAETSYLRVNIYTIIMYGEEEEKDKKR